MVAEKECFFVIPAKAEIRLHVEAWTDPRLRGDDRRPEDGFLAGSE